MQSSVSTHETVGRNGRVFLRRGPVGGACGGKDPLMGCDELMRFGLINGCFWFPLSSVGSVANRPSPNWQERYNLYTTYSPCLLGDYVLPTTF